MNTTTIITLVIALISAGISIFTALVPAWLSQLWSTQAASAKARAEFNSKKEPLLVAAINLARELSNFLDLPLPQSMWVLECNISKRHHVTKYMCYLFAVFFARVDELHKTAEFLNLEGENRRLLAVLYRIQRALMLEFEDLASGKDEVPGLMRRSDVELMVEIITKPPQSTRDKSKKEVKNGPGYVKGYDSFAKDLNVDDWRVWEPFIGLPRPWKEDSLSIKSTQTFLGEYEALVLSKDNWNLLSRLSASSASTAKSTSASPDRSRYSNGSDGDLNESDGDLNESDRGEYSKIVTLYRLRQTPSSGFDVDDKNRKEIRSDSDDAIKNEIDNSGSEIKRAGASILKGQNDDHVKPTSKSLHIEFHKSHSAPVQQEAPHTTSRSEESIHTFQDIRGQILHRYDRLCGIVQPKEWIPRDGFRPLLLGLQLIGYQQVWNYLVFQKNSSEQDYEAFPLKVEKRFRKLQHRLLELIVELDPQLKRILFETPEELDSSKGHRTQPAEYKGNILPVRISQEECGCQLPGYCKNRPCNPMPDDIEAHREKASDQRFMGWLVRYLNLTAKSKPSKSERDKITKWTNVPLRGPGNFHSSTQDSTYDLTKPTVNLKDATCTNRYYGPLEEAQQAPHPRDSHFPLGPERRPKKPSKAKKKTQGFSGNPQPGEVH